MSVVLKKDRPKVKYFVIFPESQFTRNNAGKRFTVFGEIF